jgi:hypothetical protein
MPRFLILLATAIVALATGCSPASGPEGAGQEEERAALSAEFGAVKADVRRLTPNTPEHDLQAGAKRVQNVRTRLASLTGRTAIDHTRMAALESEAKRLEAALQVQRAKRQWERLFKAAKLTRRQQRMTVDEKRAILREQWAEFRRADDGLIAAERAYTDASNELALSLKREEGLGS